MKSRRNAFTLVELVVVVLILGILAGVAAPKLLDTSKTATDNGIRQTLGIVRDAIELYAANNGGNLPTHTDGTTDLQDDLEPYIRGTFPVSPVGTKDSDVKVGSSADGTTGWMYNNSTGEFICNSTATSGDGSTTYDDF